eukprot:SAG31_NODE_15868_length_734_cov_1.074016_2_plen_32_part_01
MVDLIRSIGIHTRLLQVVKCSSLYFIPHLMPG